MRDIRLATILLKLLTAPFDVAFRYKTVVVTDRVFPVRLGSNTNFETILSHFLDLTSLATT